MNFNNKTVFITGGAQGLGMGIVKNFLEKRAKVCYGDINQEVGKATEAELQAKYGKDKVMFVAFDVTDDRQFRESFAQAVGRFGNIDIFINNAGILNEGMWEKMLQINFAGTVRGTKIAMEHMRKDKGGKGGRIVNVCSILGLVEHYATAVYSSTKHAMRAFTTSTSMTPGIESTMGIEIAALCPDAINTDLMTKLDESKIGDYDEVKQVVDQMVMPVSVVVDGMFTLVENEKSINGALLLVTKTEKSYQKMSKVDLGQQWPAPSL